MRTRRLINLTIIAVLMAISAALPYALVHASGGPVRPSCSDTPKAGLVGLNPAGTMNALTQVTYTVPFCPGGEIVTQATVDNGNTAGERVGAKPFGLTHINVSVQLDAPSSDTYLLYWRAEKATQ